MHCFFKVFSFWKQKIHINQKNALLKSFKQSNLVIYKQYAFFHVQIVKGPTSSRANNLQQYKMKQIKSQSCKDY